MSGTRIQLDLHMDQAVSLITIFGCANEVTSAFSRGIFTRSEEWFPA